MKAPAKASKKIGFLPHLIFSFPIPVSDPKICLLIFISYDTTAHKPFPLIFPFPRLSFGLPMPRTANPQEKALLQPRRKVLAVVPGDKGGSLKEPGGK
jgi:hypothetical protein